ncbi:MAG: hypothetical protein ABI067_07545 [Leifsonia sp.]
MHPQTLWLTSLYESTERERRRALIYRKDVDRGEETPPARDSRWAALLHRRTEQSPLAPEPTSASSAQLGCV